MDREGGIYGSYPLVEIPELYFLDYFSVESKIEEAITKELRIRNRTQLPTYLHENRPVKEKIPLDLMDGSFLEKLNGYFFLVCLLIVWWPLTILLAIIFLYLYISNERDYKRELDKYYQALPGIRENNNKYYQFFEDEKKVVQEIIKTDRDYYLKVEKQIRKNTILDVIAKNKPTPPDNIVQNSIGTLDIDLNKGRTEDYFYKIMIEYFKNSGIEIKRNCCLEYYYPDFVLVHPTGAYIDIEIDEPYAINTKEEIHYFDVEKNCHSDNYRNYYFLDNGWFVIRFSEKQISLDPIACCNEIADYISIHLYDKIDYSSTKPIQRDYFWTREEAKKMAEGDFRNTYLPIHLKYKPVEPVIARTRRINLPKIDWDEDYDNSGLPF